MIPFQVEFTQSAFWKGILAFLFEPILQYHVIHDLTTENASPSEKFFANTVKLFENHCSTTSMALHDRPPYLKLGKFSANFVPKLKFTYEIDKIIIL
jgi:hypothetical protein